MTANGAPPPAPGGPLIGSQEWLDDYARKRREQLASSSYNVFRAAKESGVAPDNAGRLARLSRQMRVPRYQLPTDPDKLDELEQRLELRELLTRYPNFMTSMQDVPRATMMLDDLGNFRTTVGALDTLGAWWHSGTATNDAGILKMKGAFLGGLHKLSPQDQDRLAQLNRLQENFASSPSLLGLGHAVQLAGQYLQPAILSAAAGFTGSAVSGPAAPVVGPAAALATVATHSAIVQFGHQYEDTYLQLIEEGVPQDEAHEIAKRTAGLLALPAGALDAVSFRVFGKPFVGAARAMTKIPAVSKMFRKGLDRETTARLFSDLTKQYLVTVGTETATEGAQRGLMELSELWAGALAGADIGPQSFGEFMGDVADEMWHAFQGMAWIGIPGPAIQYSAERKKVHQAKRATEMFDRLAKAGEASKTRERDAPTYAQAVAGMVGEKTKEVYVEAGDLRRGLEASGHSLQQLATDMPGVAKQLEGAEPTDDVVIPMGEFAAHVAPTKLYPAIRGDIRLQKDGFSQNRSDEWLKEREKNREESQRMVAGRAALVADWDQQSTRVETDFLAEVQKDTKRTDEESRYIAKIYRMWVETQAARLNTTPEEFAKQHRLHVQVDQQGAQQGVQQGAQPGEARTLEQFAGIKAQTSNLFDFSIAQRLQREGASKKKILEETGWFIGPDGKWRYEISDRNAEIRDEALANAWRRPRKASTKPALPLGELLDHSALFAAYPHLRDIPVMLYSGSPTSLGFAMPAPDISIGLNVHARKNTISELTSTLLHEIQHVIQEFEGFASGGSPRGFSPDMLEAIAKRDTKRVVDVARKKNPKLVASYESYLRAKKVFTDAVALSKQDPSASGDSVAIALAKRDAHQEFLKHGEAATRLVHALMKAKNPDAYDAYHRLAGEVEARNVEKRRTFTYEERIGKPAGRTADRPKYSLILRFGRDKPQLQLEGDKQWLKHEPEVTSTGKIKGAPEHVTDRKSLNAMRRLARQLLSEGEAGRFWYEESTREVLRIVQGDLVEAQRLIQLIAIYSPNAVVWTNTISAIKAYTAWKRGVKEEDFQIGLGTADKKAKDLLYRDKRWASTSTVQGRKITSFYRNLMHELLVLRPEAAEQLGLDPEFVEEMGQPVTVDIWMYRVFGYVKEAGSDDKGSGKYSFAEGEVRRLTAELNAKLEPGAAPWLPHQVQAALWTAMQSRYNMKEVREQTVRKSRREGLITEKTTKRGKTTLVYPKDSSAEHDKHYANWRSFAMKPTSEEVRGYVEENARSFATEFERLGQIVTWEAVPAKEVGAAINAASSRVREQFTAEIAQLLVDENGNDLLAAMLGVHLAFSQQGFGTFEGKVNPNVLAHLLPAKEKGAETFTTEQVRLYARAIQFITRQAAVPWFRPDNLPLRSKARKQAQMFRVVRSDTGRLVPKGRFETQAKAQAFADSMGPGVEVRGGDLARAVVMRFGGVLDGARLATILGALQQHLPGQDFTRTADNEITVVNFRDDGTKLPFARTDEEFLSAIESLGAQDADAVGLIDLVDIWTQGEYGQTHDWQEDQAGGALAESFRGRPDLLAWVRGRQAEFDDILARYDADGIADLERSSAEQRAPRQFDEGGSKRPTPISGVTDTGSPEFIKWFGESKVVDVATGKPLVVFHGATEEFDVFEPGEFVPGNWFTSDREHAQSFGDPREFYLSLQSPVVIQDPSDVVGDLDGYKADKALGEYLREKESEGHDGAIISNWEGSGNVYIAFDPEQIKSVNNRGTFDPNDPSVLRAGPRPDPRGRYEPDVSTAWFLKERDATTWLHEMSHHYMSMLFKTAMMPNANPQLKADARAALNWFGIAGETLDAQLVAWDALGREGQRRHWESFAYNWELWLHKGQAPSLELESVFRAITRWFRRAYGHVVRVLNKAYKEEFGVDLPALTPEVRGVFDRMLASENAILAVQAERSMDPMFRTQPEGMSDLDWAELQLNQDAATEDAINGLTRASIAAAKWMGDATGRLLKKVQAQTRTIRKTVENEERREVEQERVYQARRVLLRAEHVAPDGTVEPALIPKLNTAETKRLLEADIPDADLRRDLRGMTSPDGWHPDRVAELLNYSSGAEMIKELIAAAPLEEVVRQRSDRRMLEEHSDLLDEDKMRRKIEEVLHGESRSKVVAAELRFFDKLTRPVRVIVRAARTHAKNLIADKLVGAVRPHDHSLEKARYRREAQRAFVKGELALAASLKRRELLATEMAREAVAVRAEVDRAQKEFRKLFRSDAKLAPRYEIDYIAIARSLVASFGLQPGDRDASSYLTAVRDHNPQLLDKLQPMFDRARDWRAEAEKRGSPVKDWRDLTVEEFRELRETVGGLWALARAERKFELDGKKMELDDAAKLLLEQDAENPVKAIEMTGQLHGWEKVKDKARSMLLKAVRPENWFYRKDGAKTGWFTKLFWQPIREAVERYMVDRTAYTKRIEKMVRDLRPKLKMGKIEFRTEDGKKLLWTFGQGNGGFGHAELIAALLHTGNRGNLRRLIVGHKWGRVFDDVKDAANDFDTSQWDSFVAQMVEEGFITTDVMDFVQAVWDMNDELKPLAQSAHKELLGHRFEEVTATEVNIPGVGTYRGGYMPAKLDKTARSAGRLQDLKDLEADYRQQFATTGRGFTKGRAKKFAERLLLDLDLVPSHIDDVLRFAHLQPAVRAAERLGKHEAVADSIEATSPGAWNGMILPWLQRTASQSATRAGKDPDVDIFWRNARSVAGMTLMMANVVNAAQQFLQIAVAAARIKPRYLLKSLWGVIGGRKTRYAEIARMSPGMMAPRQKNQIFDSVERINDLMQNRSKFAKARAWTRQHAYFLQTAVQNWVDAIVWGAAYEQKLNEATRDVSNETAQREAIRHADATVRMTQHSFDPTDVAGFEEGTPFVKIFSQFAGWFNTMANLQADEFTRIARAQGWEKAGVAMHMYIFTFLIPMIGSELMTQAMRGQLDDEDEDGSLLDDAFVDVVLLGHLRSLAAEVPLLGPNAINPAIGWFDDKVWNDRMTSTPAISLIERVGLGSARALRRVTSGEELTSRNVRDVTSGVGLLLGLPPVGKQVGVGAAVGAPDSFDDMRAYITGVLSEEQRAEEAR